MRRGDRAVLLGELAMIEPGAEMVLPIWLRLLGALETPMFNLKVVT